MRQVYECTDCKACLNFDYGYRVFCGHPRLKADAVYQYEPVGDRSADLCPEFDEDFRLTNYNVDQLVEAEKYSVEKLGDLTEDGIRMWAVEVMGWHL